VNILMAAGVARRREGGVAGIVHNLARCMGELGHAVTCLFAEDVVPVERRSTRLSQMWFSLYLARYVMQRRNRFSLVNLHGPAGLFYGLRRRYLRTPGPPNVMTLHGLEERRVHALKREAAKGRAPFFALKNRVWHRVYHQPRYDWAIRTADGVHCFSREVWTILQLKYDLDWQCAAYIPNGVSEAFFVERDYSEARPLRLLYAGTWLDQRGIFYLRDALPQVFATRPDIRFTFAGLGAPAEKIRAFFGDSVAGRLDIVETVPWDRMPQLYAEHDIFVFPSLMEGQPGVVLEAMASGMPVITTETCGMVDVIEDGFEGLLIPPADAGAIQTAILRLANSPTERERLGRAAQERMRRRTWRVAALRLEEFFKRVISSSSRRGG
jgi:glycosyltransferase involved in cell wall biosynthesis